MKTTWGLARSNDLAFSISRQAHAHYLWLERDGTGPAKAYFGEYADDLHEKAGGLLNCFKNPRAFLTSPNELLPIENAPMAST